MPPSLSHVQYSRMPVTRHNLNPGGFECIGLFTRFTQL